MSTVVVYADTADDTIYTGSATYSLARSGTGAAVLGGSACYAGQALSGGTYRVYESFLSFDTSSLSGTPTSVVLSLYGTIALTGTVYARAYDWGSSVTTGDFIAGASLSGNPLRASITNPASGSYQDFTSDASFIGNLANPVRLVLCSARVESNSTPTGSEFFGFSSADAAGTTQDPKLTATYPSAPGTPTLAASGTSGGYALGVDVFGRVLISATDGAGDPSTSVNAADRSADGGSTFADALTHGTVIGSASPFIFSDNRPDHGSQAVANGGQGKYRIKLANSGGASGFSATLTVDPIAIDRPGVERKYAQALKTYLDTSANANAEADGAYPGVSLSALAYAKAAGYAPSSGDYLTVCSDFWALIKSRGNINADYIFTPAAYAGTTQIRRDFHFRLVVHLIVAARILRDNVGGTTATTLASDMLDYANRMGKAAFDHLARSTNLDTNTGDTYHTAWSSGAFAAGEIRKPTAPNGHYYRAMNAGANTTEPTWPTPSGSTVTHQGVTWEECSYTADTFAQTYNPAGYLPTGTYTWDGNQNSEIAAALMLLRDEPGTDFAPGGSYATSGYNHAVGELSLCAVMQYKNGEVPVTATGPHDTHYGSFQFHTTAIALHILGPGVVTQADLWLARVASWFSGTYSTEPGVSNATANGTGGGYATYHRLAEPVWRAAGFHVAGIADPLDGLYYRSCYVQGTDTIYSEWGYTPANAAYPYAYFFEALADAMAVIARIDITPAGETDAAVNPGVTKHVTLTPATEIDAAVAVTSHQPHAVTLTPATETDAAQTLNYSVVSGSQTVNLTPATESDNAVVLVPAKRATITSSTEVDVAVTLTKKKEATLSPASEADSATSLSYTGYVSPSTRPRILLNTYVSSAQFGSKTVSSDTFGSRTARANSETTTS